MSVVAEELDALYHKVNCEGEEAIRNEREVLDQFLDNIDADKRSGLTLQIDIHGATNELYKKAIKSIQEIEPNIYIYPDSDLHVTVIDFISANLKYVKDDDQNNKIMELIEKALCGITKFDLVFQGLIVSDAAVLGKGYYIQGLNQIRNNIRKLAREQNINLEQRYQRTSAHFTGLRFKSPLRNRSEFVKVVQEYNFSEVGAFRVNELELVIHDWYNRRKAVIKKFILP
ncbi:2'-5' RNA ligase family protein [Sporomusa malonica]|uniref:Uncharacterized protein n=1 Tax=Sporomusa malonica TaxID=112901 RepID=A0A1W1Y7D8_9FIRM|nr:hypothetical protein [Sporomusa malonica]SMC32120.1 hypothetical protein SAMN04488500_10178 [Sporomusa malonica]